MPERVDGKLYALPSDLEPPTHQNKAPRSMPLWKQDVIERARRAEEQMAMARSVVDEWTFYLHKSIDEVLVKIRNDRAHISQKLRLRKLVTRLFEMEDWLAGLEQNHVQAKAEFETLLAYKPKSRRSQEVVKKGRSASLC